MAKHATREMAVVILGDWTDYSQLSVLVRDGNLEVWDDEEEHITPIAQFDLADPSSLDQIAEFFRGVNS